MLLYIHTNIVYNIVLHLGIDCVFETANLHAFWDDVVALKVGGNFKRGWLVFLES